MFISTQLLDELEPVASEGGLILDWHTCDVFPERWIDLVIVLRCDHTKLWERLEKRYGVLVVKYFRLCLFTTSLFTPNRNYPLKKIQENNESEIMQCVLDEARESYAKEIVVELKSESTEDIENNVDRIVQWIRTWRKERGFEDKEGS